MARGGWLGVTRVHFDFTDEVRDILRLTVGRGLHVYTLNSQLKFVTS